MKRVQQLRKPALGSHARSISFAIPPSCMALQVEPIALRNSLSILSLKTSEILEFSPDETRPAKTITNRCTHGNAKRFVRASGKRTISKKAILNFLPRYPRTNDCARQFRHSIDRADFI